MKKSEEMLCELWTTIKRNNLFIIGIPKEERENGAKSSFKVIMAENIPNLGRDLDIQFIKLIGHPKLQPQTIFSKTHDNKIV